MTPPATPRWTPEPWHCADRGVGWEIHAGPPPEGRTCYEPDAAGKYHECRNINEGQGRHETFTEVDARRIVACVNALSGMDPEAVGKMAEELKDARALLRRIDNLLAAAGVEVKRAD